MADGVQDVDMGMQALMALFAEISGEEVVVQVGFPEGANPDPEIVARAGANEFGTSTIPERPFMRTTVDQGQGEILDDLIDVGHHILDGEPLDVELDILGEKWAGKMQDEIYDWTDPPNAPATIAEKGFNDPLVRSGEMARAVTWDVVS